MVTPDRPRTADSKVPTSNGLTPKRRLLMKRLSKTTRTNLRLHRSGPDGFPGRPRARRSSPALLPAPSECRLRGRGLPQEMKSMRRSPERKAECGRPKKHHHQKEKPPRCNRVLDQLGYGLREKYGLIGINAGDHVFQQASRLCWRSETFTTRKLIPLAPLRERKIDRGTRSNVEGAVACRRDDPDHLAPYGRGRIFCIDQFSQRILVRPQSSCRTLINDGYLWSIRSICFADRPGLMIRTPMVSRKPGETSFTATTSGLLSPRAMPVVCSLAPLYSPTRGRAVETAADSIPGVSAQLIQHLLVEEFHISPLGIPGRRQNGDRVQDVIWFIAGIGRTVG